MHHFQERARAQQPAQRENRQEKHREIDCGKKHICATCRDTGRGQPAPRASRSRRFRRQCNILSPPSQRKRHLAPGNFSNMPACPADGGRASHAIRPHRPPIEQLGHAPDIDRPGGIRPIWLRLGHGPHRSNMRSFFPGGINQPAGGCDLSQRSRARWQRQARPGASSASGGSLARQTSNAYWQRG